MTAKTADLVKALESLQHEIEVLQIVAGDSPATIGQSEFTFIALWWQDHSEGQTVRIVWRYIQRVSECQPERISTFNRNWSLGF